MKNWNLQNPLPGGFQTHLMTSASKNECPRTKFQPKLSQETSNLKFFVRKTCFETQFLVGTKINVFWTLMMIINDDHSSGIWLVLEQILELLGYREIFFQKKSAFLKKMLDFVRCWGF